MSEELPEKDNTGAVKALATFCDKYEPAKPPETPFTDFFNSQEIQRLVRSHTGYSFDLMELHEMLQQMGYTYRLEGTEFIWEVHKVTND